MKKMALLLALIMLLGSAGIGRAAGAATREEALQQLESLASLAESAIPWRTKYLNMNKEALAPYEEQLGDRFYLYGRRRKDGPFYILLLPRDGVEVPEIAGSVLGDGVSSVQDANGDTFLEVTGASDLGFVGNIGVIGNYEGLFDNILAEPLPNIYQAAENPESIAQALSAGIYPAMPPGEICLEIYTNEIQGYFRLDEGLQQKIEKQTKSLGSGEKLDMRGEQYCTFVYLRKDGDEDFGGFLWSDGSLGDWGAMRRYPKIAPLINTALDSLEAKTGLDPRGYDFGNIRDLTRATLVMPGRGCDNAPSEQTVTDPEKLDMLARIFRESTKDGGGKCPYEGSLTLYGKSGEKIEIMVASDSCSTAEISHNGFSIGIDYGEDFEEGTDRRRVMEEIFDELFWS